MIEVCPYCDSSAHKVVALKENLFFCKQCSRFFYLEKIKLACPKCDSKNISEADYPLPDGTVAFHCNRCKKIFSTKTLLESNKKITKK